MNFPNVPGWVPVFRAREATEEERSATDLPEGCDDLLVLEMPPLPDPFKRVRTA